MIVSFNYVFSACFFFACFSLLFSLLFIIYYSHVFLSYYVFPGLDHKIGVLLRGGYRPSTKRTYSSVQSRFCKFCSQHNLVAVPASELTILRFIAFITPKVSHNSMPVYLAAIRALHIVNGHPAPPITTPRIQLTLRSLSQTANPIKQAHPITFSIMHKFYNMLSGSQDDLTFWAGITVLFFGCLRASEIVPTVEQYEWGFLPPLVENVQFAPPPEKAVIIKVARTKTKPTGRLIVLGCSGHCVCPYCAMVTHLYSHGIRDTRCLKRPLFLLRDGSVMDKTYVRSRQSVLLAALGISPEGFTTHSYRSGSATSLTINGHFDLITHVGDWSSLCYMRYIRSPMSALSAIASKFVPSGHS